MQIKRKENCLFTQEVDNKELEVSFKCQGQIIYQVHWQIHKLQEQPAPEVFTVVLTLYGSERPEIDMAEKFWATPPTVHWLPGVTVHTEESCTKAKAVLCFLAHSVSGKPPTFLLGIPEESLTQVWKRVSEEKY